MAVNRGLGKGLSALFSDTDAEYLNSENINPTQVSDSRFSPPQSKAATDGAPAKIDIDLIYANPSQPRRLFDTDALQELADSIRQHGIVQPISLNRDGDGKYMIIAGERRYRAAKIAGLTQVPAVIGEFSQREIKEIALIENLQREDLNSIEAATAIKQLMEEYKLTQEDAAKRIGKSRPAVANLLRLLTLPQEIISYVRQGSLSEGHARALIGAETYFAITLARQAMDKGLSVREVESLVKGKKRPAPSAFSAQSQPQPQQSRELKDLINHMQRVFGTKVSAVGTDSKGRIYIDYFTTDDLDRIFDIVEKLKR